MNSSSTNLNDTNTDHGFMRHGTKHVPELHAISPWNRLIEIKNIYWKKIHFEINEITDIIGNTLLKAFMYNAL